MISLFVAALLAWAEVFFGLLDTDIIDILYISKQSEDIR